MRGAVRILFRTCSEKALNRILPDVILELLVFQRISQSPVQKARLPDHSLSLQLLVQLKRKPTLDKLHSSLQSDFSWGQDQMEMVGHDHKLVQQVLLLRSVIQQNLNEEAGDFLYLKEASLFKNICRHKICGFGGHASVRNSQI